MLGFEIVPRLFAMGIPEPLKSLLVECVGCTVNCYGIQLDPERGIIPRGFWFGSATIQDKDLVVIFPEPKSSNLSEQKRYRRAKHQGGWESVSEEVNRFAEEHFKYARSDFHCRTMGLLTEVFKSRREVFRRCYFTELTKCQKSPGTPRGKKTLWGKTRKECLKRYLRRELAIVQPKVALLFGDAVKRYQGEIDSILQNEGCPKVLAQHPSHPRPKWMHKNPDRERIIRELRSPLSL